MTKTEYFPNTLSTCPVSVGKPRGGVRHLLQGGGDEEECMCGKDLIPTDSYVYGDYSKVNCKKCLKTFNKKYDGITVYGREIYVDNSKLRKKSTYVFTNKRPFVKKILFRDIKVGDIKGKIDSATRGCKS